MGPIDLLGLVMKYKVSRLIVLAKLRSPLLKGVGRAGLMRFMAEAFSQQAGLTAGGTKRNVRQRLWM
jgi:hypothetical protein